MDSQVKKSRKSFTDSGFRFTLFDVTRRLGNCVTVEVVSLRDMPLPERQRAVELRTSRCTWREMSSTHPHTRIVFQSPKAENVIGIEYKLVQKIMEVEK